MNRLVFRISAVCLGASIAFAPSAFARKHKKHKQVDLSANPLANVHSEQPDKILYDKAMVAMKKGKYDIARLDLQTLLNTYSESEYAMRAKLAVGDTWFKEGGTAALAQAESEYKDFITFFPNSPEAAEAQMKVGDIYFQQMQKPDRDPQNAEAAEREYRTMLEQFPDSPLIPRAKQRLRDVQEVLAQRQYEIGQYYFSRENWAASIARLQTVADTYPLFSHSDETLISIGDAYATEAQMMSQLRLPAKTKAEIARYYDNQAAAAWDRVVTRYPLSAHVEDAKDRLIAMGRPIPNPTPQELAESQAEEESRTNVKLGAKSLIQMLGSGPSTVKAARVGEPSLSSPPPVLAPEVLQQSKDVYEAAVQNKPIPSGPSNMAQPAAVTASAQNGAAQQGGEAPGGQLTLEQVPDASGAPGSTVTVQAPADNGSSVESAPDDSVTAAPVQGNNQPLVAPIGPTNNKPLPAIDKPAAAPQQINEVPAGQSGGAQVSTGANASGKPVKKRKKAPYNKKDESSSKHHGKKGIGKLNPF